MSIMYIVYIALHEKWELVSMDNVYQCKAIFVWIGVTIFYEQLMTLYMDNFSKIVEFK